MKGKLQDVRSACSVSVNRSAASVHSSRNVSTPLSKVGVNCRFPCILLVFQFLSLSTVIDIVYAFLFLEARTYSPVPYG